MFLRSLLSSRSRGHGSSSVLLTTLWLVAMMIVASASSQVPSPLIRVAATDAATAQSTLPPNPILSRVADPSVLRAGRFFYAYSTSNFKDSQDVGAMPVYRSTDLIHWTRVGQIFRNDHLPSWTAPDQTGIHKFWGPDVHLIGGQYVAYYSALDRRGQFSVGVATAPHPWGPFRDRGIVRRESGFGIIDPSFFRDPKDGALYLLWKNNVNPDKPTDILLQRLRSDGLRLVRGTPTRLIKNTLGWEGAVVEAPTLVYRRGVYVLFYSGNAVSTDHYAVGFARSADRVTGPYEKPGGLGPILRSDPEFVGPGGQTVLRVDGQWLMFYHAQVRGSRPRDLMVDKIWWDSAGLPHVNDGTPRNAEAATVATPSAPAATATVGGATPADTCQWVVRWDDAGVYELPRRDQEPVKTKHRGDQVGGGYCMKHFNESEGEWYVAVTCARAEDGIGWMRLNALDPV